MIASESLSSHASLLLSRRMLTGSWTFTGQCAHGRDAGRASSNLTDNSSSASACAVARDLQNYRVTAILQDMKITLTMTSRGVITLPSKLRRQLGLSADDHLIAETTAEGLLLRPAITLPIEMYTADRVSEFDHEEAQLATLFERKAAVRKRPGRSGRKASG